MRTKSSGSAKATFIDRDGIWNAVRELAGQLGREHRLIRTISAFGSTVRGESVPGSDVDLLIEVDRSDLAFKDRGDEFRPAAFPTSLDIFVYTTTEMATMLADGNSFLRKASGESVILYERSGT